MPVKNVMTVDIPAMRSELYKGNQSIVPRSLEKAAGYVKKGAEAFGSLSRGERRKPLRGYFSGIANPILSKTAVASGPLRYSTKAFAAASCFVPLSIAAG